MSFSLQQKKKGYLIFCLATGFQNPERRLLLLETIFKQSNDL